MNILKLSSQRVRAFMVSIIVCFLFIPCIYPSNIEISEGVWISESLERNIQSFPITAYLNDNYIQIINNKPDCDITVSILSINTGEIIIQQTVPESATSNIIIPVINLSSGEYVLELTDSGTRYLRGTFRK